MWLNLAKVSPALLVAVRERPELIDTLFGDEAQAPDGFHPIADTFNYDYRTLASVAECLAEVGDGGSRDEGVATGFARCYPWLAAITGDFGWVDGVGEQLDGYEFCYGPAFVISQDQVEAVVAGLVAEGWDIDPSEDGEAAESERSYDEFEDLVPFLRIAARRGMAVVGGVG